MPQTLLVSGRSQKHPSQPLELIEYEALPAVKRLSIGDLAGKLYPGVAQMRTCLVRAEYVLDFFQARAASPQDLDWLLHIDGIAQRRGDRQVPEAVSFPDHAPWNYLRSPVRLTRSSRYTEAFRHGEQKLRVDVTCSGVQEVIGCGFPRDDRTDPDVIPMRIFRSKSTDAWYAAVYRIGKGIDEPIQLEVTPGPLGTWQVTIRLADKRYTHRVPRLKEPAAPAWLTCLVSSTCSAGEPYSRVSDRPQSISPNRLRSSRTAVMAFIASWSTPASGISRFASNVSWTCGPSSHRGLVLYQKCPARWNRGQHHQDRNRR